MLRESSFNTGTTEINFAEGPPSGPSLVLLHGLPGHWQEFLLILRVTWESTTKEERKDLVYIMIQEVGVDMEIKHVLWVKARPDYDPLFSILDGLRHDAARRFWIESFVPPEDNCDVEEDTGQVSAGVEILLPMSHNTLTRAEEYI